MKKSVLSNIVKKAELSINLKKTTYYDLRKGSVVINGIGINLNGRMYIPRKHLFETKGRLFMAVHKGVEVDPRVMAGRVSLIKDILRACRKSLGTTSSPRKHHNGMMSSPLCKNAQNSRKVARLPNG